MGVYTQGELGQKRFESGLELQAGVNGAIDKLLTSFPPMRLQQSQGMEKPKISWGGMPGPPDPPRGIKSNSRLLAPPPPPPPPPHFEKVIYTPGVQIESHTNTTSENSLIYGNICV